ncbi:MAG TPA: hypothetical protein VIL86_11525 [Tepidisphaeraceae bacterium]
MHARLIRWGFVGWAVLALAGCKSNHHQKTEPKERPVSPSTQPVASPTTEPDVMQADAGILAKKAATYAQDVGPLLAKRQAKTLPGDSSSGIWADPNDLRLSPQARPQGAASTPPAPNVDATNQMIAVTPPTTQGAPATAGAGASQRSQTGNDPRLAAASLGAEKSVTLISSDILERKLAQRIKDNPRDVAGHLEYQLFQFLRDADAPNMAAFGSLPAEDRELITTLLDGLTNFRNTLRADNNMLLSKKVKPLMELADRLRAQADLSIPTICLCTKVEAFGKYEPIEPARFPAGREHEVIVYCELENFASRLGDNKMWETKLTEEVVIYTETGMQVWPKEPNKAALSDVSRNRRHDFFLVKKIHLPSNLTIGRYLMKVSVVDQQASRVAEATLPIAVVAQ